MYSLFKNAPSRKLGQVVDPNIHYIRRIYAEQIRDVKSYYRRAPKYVESKNILAQMIRHFNVELLSDDATFIKNVDDRSRAIIRSFGITSSLNKGKVHVGGVTLGPQTEEVLVSTSESFDLKDLNKTWYKLSPVTYLYHTRTDTNLPIMNNTTQGRGYGVTLVNIPMLLVMYRYWYRWQVEKNPDEVEDTYRFIGSFVLSNMVDSYLDISFFNRLARNALDIKNPTFPIPHPFYITDMNPRIDKLCTTINRESILKGVDMEGLSWITPAIVQSNLFDMMRLPREPINRNNEWAYVLARTPFIKYLVGQLLKNTGYDQSSVNTVLIDLIEASNDQAFKQQANSEFVKAQQAQVDWMIDALKRKEM
ncbi:hypothetical protein NP274_00216 [Pseudomonas phage Koomba boorn-mokiny kep-wari Wadjak 2]|nr:hypothetical protein NP274_00216 [Pseudomonas phage Koomba boorn-mokiny kep-wari Wadjak 2]